MAGLIRRKPAQPVTAERFLTLKEAATRLRLDESTIRKGKAGTGHFTLIRQGEGKRRPIFLLESEVEAHVRQLIDTAQAQKARPFQLVYGSDES